MEDLKFFEIAEFFRDETILAGPPSEMPRQVMEEDGWWPRPMP